MPNGLCLPLKVCSYVRVHIRANINSGRLQNIHKIYENFPTLNGTFPVTLALKDLSKLITVKGFSPSSPHQVTLHPLREWSDLRLSLSHYMRRYREEVGPLPLQLSTNNLSLLVRLHRTLKFARYWGLAGATYL